MRSAVARIAGAFAAAAAAAAGFAIVYSIDGSVQLQGLLLGTALAGVGYGLIVWSRDLMDPTEATEARRSLAPPPDAEKAAAQAYTGGRGRMPRRGLLGWLLATALGALGVAFAFPLRSLAPATLPEPGATAWRRGRRLVTADGRPVRADALQVGVSITVFPEGHEGDAQAQVILVRVEPGLLRPAPGRAVWSPRGHVAYSKVCTHAGCPVGLYQPRLHVLLCPCHQSTFDVLAGAAPRFGPATRPLPQLPLMVDGGGWLAAAAGLTEPVGPASWRYPS